MTTKTITTDIYDSTGEKAGTISLPAAVFGVEVNEALLAQAVHVYRTNQRKYTAHTKQRGEVQGGGKKPWRQKGTGKARQGSTRAPNWRGGGIVFGPRAHKPHLLRMTKKMQQAAFRSALSQKVQNAEIVVMKNIAFEDRKTKQAHELLKKLPLKKNNLILLNDPNESTTASLRNLASVSVQRIDTLSVYDLMRTQILVMPQACIDVFAQRYGQKEQSATASSVKE